MLLAAIPASRDGVGGTWWTILSGIDVRKCRSVQEVPSDPFPFCALFNCRSLVEVREYGARRHEACS